MSFSLSVAAILSLLLTLYSRTDLHAQQPTDAGHIASAVYLEDAPTVVAEERGLFADQGNQAEVTHHASGKLSMAKLRDGEPPGTSDAVNEPSRRGRDIHPREATWADATLAAAALIFGALSVIVIGFIHRRVARPTRSITNTLERLRKGETGARAPVTGNDEQRRLAETLNKTLDERDAADAELIERQEKLQSALERLADTRDRMVRAQAIADIGSWDFDLKNERLEWSDQVFRILGLRRDEFDGRLETFFECVHPEDREWLRQQMTEWLDSGGVLEVDHRIVRPNGDVRWVREQAQVIPDPNGRPASTTGTVQDITDQHRLDERVKQLQLLIESSDDWYGIIDESYRFLWANRAYIERYGLDPDALPGTPLADIVGQTYFESVLRPRVDACLGGEIQRFETTRDLPGQPDRKLLVRYYPVDMLGRTTRLLGAVITDITDVRRAEAEVERQGRLLDVAGRAARFGAWSVDLESNRIEWSDVVAELHGMPHSYSPTVEEGIQFYAPEYRERIADLFWACAKLGEPYDEELQVIDANGQRRWVRVVGEAVRDEEGDVIRVQGAFQDISPRKELESEKSRLADRLAAMLEAITDGFVAFDEQWRYTYVNAEAERMLGKSARELLGTSVWEQFPDLAGTPTERALKESMHERVSSTAEEFFEPLDAWFEAHAYPSEEGVAVFFRDVTETRRMLEQLQAHQAALRASRDELDAALNTRQILINSLPAHIAMLDENGTVLDVNDQWRHYGEQNQFHNGSSDFGVGTNYVELCEAAEGEGSEEAKIVADGLRDVLQGERETFALEYPCHSPDKQRWFRVMFSRLSTEGTVTGGAVAMHIDITERKRAEQEINRLAYQDPLTGTLSRNGFVRSLNERLEQEGWPDNGVVAIVDVVNQHDINDAHGYDRGDRLLVALSRRLQNLAGDRGLTGRTGGDEFVVYSTLADTDRPHAFLDRLEQAVEKPFHLDDGDLAIEIDLRIGYTTLGEESRDAHDLIREAELALFEHRRRASAGEGRIPFTHDIHERTRQRIRLTRELGRALEAEEFELHFQPKVNLSDGSMISAEALIRWRHPERGLLSPGLFIPVAEQSQLIGPIGDWALRAACRQLRDWRRDKLDAIPVSVNVSQVQFMLGDFSAKVRSALEEFDVAPEHLSLEITESVFERQSERLLSEIHELHKLGVRLSLDDFGTGYSSLLYLQRYPFDEIKIDRGFVNRLLDDAYSRDIVLAVMNLTRALDAEVVAEGIESKEISEALLEMGCEVGQGFYYSMPLESEDFRWLLRQRSKLPLGASKRDAAGRSDL
ncbi:MULTISPECIES: EAL domain-containing protein [unclassified Wenzhouxiangella]|uniref:bifunctional diguanylate cyclase/phosphodiesterase n=1 Tax=unclassified Wenzhouxiangella TaxID=2613841 RepID=UPI000E3705FF|nr:MULTISPECIES: EAL domain-containing protein [unclassified Wenzhouxiangella]RFF27784.1 EAL domain-containing protein [Wenzhouxiangella sp. 15181]